MFFPFLLIIPILIRGRQKRLELGGGTLRFCSIMCFIGFCFYYSRRKERVFFSLGLVYWLVGWARFLAWVLFLIPSYTPPSPFTFSSCLDISMSFSQIPQHAVAAWVRVKIAFVFVFIVFLLPSFLCCTGLFNGLLVVFSLGR